MGSETSTPKGRAGVLDGIRVVELAQNAAVPYCGRLLAGMGADVVKIEPPGGDAMRRLGDLGSSEAKAYAAINPGKRSIVLDLGSDDAAEVLDGLFRWADVVLVGVKGSDLARFGIGWDRVRAVNPSVVHLTHTPFGPEGPDAEVGGYDVLVQALSGAGFLMNRSQDGVPLPTRPAVNDFGTGIASALAVVAALWHRDRTGEGQRVDTSLLATALGLGTAVIHQFDADEDDLRAFRSEIRAIPSPGGGFDRQRELYEGGMLQGQVAFRLYFRTYATSDGLVSVAGMSTSLYRRFHEATGITRPPSGAGASDPGFLAVVDEAERCFASATTGHWMGVLRAIGYPCSRYNRPDEAIEDPQVVANDLVVGLDHPVFGHYVTTGMPLRMEATPVVVRGPSPCLGAHTVEVLTEIGFDPRRIEELLRAGAVASGGQSSVEPQPDEQRSTREGP